ncbi:hypothetical protein SK128_024086, partial [Halocaridina rubra]
MTRDQFSQARNVPRVEADSSWKRVPEHGSGRKEAVTAPTNPQAANLHTVPVRRDRLAYVTRPRLRGTDANRKLIRALMEPQAASSLTNPRFRGCHFLIAQHSRNE